MQRAEFQIATHAVRANWRVPEGAEHDVVWAFMVKDYPFYADYQASTERHIPVVMLQAFEEIPVFKGR